MPERASGNAISLRGVTKRYRLYGSAAQMAADQFGYYRLRFWRKRPVFEEFDALGAVSLDVRHGERVGIIGRNGAGKTTLLKLLTGNFAPTAGEVVVDGSVQALMQVGLGFHPEFTGRDNIEHALAYNGLTGAALKAAIDDVIDFAELGEFLRQPMKTYSLGMTTRLQFATATAIRPDILIIDEVLGAGDAYFSAKSAHRMRKLTSSGCTLLLVSHATEQILQFCDRAVWLEHGAIKADGRVLEVVQQYEEFIAGMSAKAERHGVASAASLEEENYGNDFATPPWQQEAVGQVLLNGSPIEKLSRWPGVAGLLVSRVELTDSGGVARSKFRTGETIRIRVGVKIDRPGAYPLRFALLFMTETGTAITRVLSPRFQIECQSAEERTFELVLPSNSFSQQTIIFSIAAFKEYDPVHPESAVKYDLLARSCRFSIWGGTPNDPGIVSMVADWQAAS